MKKFVIAIVLTGLVGCGGETTPVDPTSTAPDAKPEAPATEIPSFSLAWSEYPSWSTFGVAHELGLLNGKKGKMGEIEKKWNVDVVLNEADYDSCITMYGAGQVDAAALTNMDALPASITKKTVGILPTSTSVGGDALLVTDAIKSIQDLKGKSVYGLALTVSEFTFVRNLEINGENEKDYKFSNMDPAAAAIAMQQKQDGYDAIVVWNPFVMETLKKRSDVRVLFDSSSIPGEIIDMVVMSQDSLDKPGADRFAHAVADAFYAVNAKINDPETREDTLVALGEKFSHLGAEDMEKVVTQTRFFDTPDAGLAVFEGDEVQDIMKTVISFESSHEMLRSIPTVGFGSKEAAADANFRFDPTYMKVVQASMAKEAAEAPAAEAPAAEAPAAEAPAAEAPAEE
jgi:NitT/TauT family transport system substrate-binding protein